MFTGLIQAVGTINRHGKGLVVTGCESFSPLSLGDSVSVDGVCLTVERLVPNGFLAAVSEETLKRTTLGIKCESGSAVNLEPAIRLSDRLGGHLVSGHVDGIGEVIQVNALENSWQIELCWQDFQFSRYVCQKASISLNGISLTVANSIDEGRKFSLSIIAHTWEYTSLKYMREGDLVNLEVDLMAKYAESLLKAMKKESKKENENYPEIISKKWLEKQGWT